MSSVSGASILREIQSLAYENRRPATSPQVKPHEIVYLRRGLVVQGKLDLRSISGDFGVEFRGCIFEDPVILAYSSLKFVRFYDCEIAALDGMGLEVKDDFAIASTSRDEGRISRCFATVRLTNANIGKRLVLNGTEFNEGNKEVVLNAFLNVSDVAPRGAIDAGHVKIGSTLWMASVTKFGQTHPFRSFGCVSFRGAQIHGKVYCDAGIFVAGRHASHCVRPSPIDNLAGEECEEVKRGFVRSYRLCGDLFSIDYDSRRILSDDEVQDAFDPSLKKLVPNVGQRYLLTVLSFDMYRAYVKGGVSFYRCIFEGTARFGGADFGYKFSLQGSRFSEVSTLFLRVPENQKLYNLIKNAVKIFCYYGSSALVPRGSIDAFRMRIGGSLYITSQFRSFSSNRGVGDLYSYGRISFTDSIIGGRVVVSGACIVKTCDFPASRSKPMASLELAGITVAQNLHISDGFFGIGTTILSRSKIEGNLFIHKAKFVADGDGEFALCADNIQVKNEVLIDGDSVFSGKTSFRGSTIQSSCIIKNSMFFDRVNRRFDEGNEGNQAVYRAVGDVRSWTKTDLLGDRSRIGFKNNLMDEILSRLDYVLSRVPFYLMSDGHLLNFHGAVIGGSFRLSSWKHSGDYSAVLGVLSLEGMVVKEELDLCSSRLSDTIEGLGVYRSWAERRVQRKQLEPTKFDDENSIFGIDLRYVEAGVLRVNRYLPSVGCVLVSGLQFRGLSGEFLQNPEVAKKFLQVSAHLIGSEKNSYGGIERGEDVRFYNLAMLMNQNLRSGDSLEEYSSFCKRGSYFLGDKYYWTIRLHNQVANQLLKHYKEVVEPVAYSEIDEYVNIANNSEVSSAGCWRLSFSRPASWVVFVIVSALFAMPTFGFFNLREKLFMIVSALSFLAIYNSFQKKSETLKNDYNSAVWGRLMKGGIRFKRVVSITRVKRFLDFMTGFGLHPSKTLVMFLIFCVFVSQIFSALARRGIFVEDDGIVIKSKAAVGEYAGNDEWLIIYSALSRVFAMAFPSIGMDSSSHYMHLEEVPFKPDPKLPKSFEVYGGVNEWSVHFGVSDMNSDHFEPSPSALKIWHAYDGKLRMLLDILVWTVRISGWVVLGIMLTSLRHLMRKI
jgi:hypothetical protein